MNLMKNLAVIFAKIALFAMLCACSVQTSPSLLTSTKTGSTETVNKIIEAVPFAYDLAVDTISYNSCVGIDLNNGGLHGFKIGANEGFVDPNGNGSVKGGLKLRSDFLQYLATNITPNYPNTTIVPSQIQYILQNSTNNMSSASAPPLYVQYAVRTAADLNIVPDVITPNSNAAIQQTRDGVYEYTALTESNILDGTTKSIVFGPNQTVISEGPRIYNIGPKDSPKPFEGSLGYSKIIDETFPSSDADDGQGAGENYADNVRLKFNSGTYVLAVTYGNPATVGSSDATLGASFGLNAPKRKEGAAANRAYGRAFELAFVSKNAAKTCHRKNVINRVTEKNLDDGSAVAVSWECENFVIMKTNEWNNKKATEPACSELTATDLLETGIKDKVAKIRRQYPESMWGIGRYFERNAVGAVRVNRPLCLVHKSVECYLPTVGLITSAPTEDIGVEYDTTKECYLSRYRQMGVTYTGNLSGDAARRLRRCPQYASICIRK